MNKVFISRPDINTTWGFRLQGGYEFNEPLSLTNILPNSPADGKIKSGDKLIEIAGTNVTHMTHKDVLELIQRCGNALFLTIHRVDASHPTIPISKMRRFSEQQQTYNHDSSSASYYNPHPIPNENIPRTESTFDTNFITNTSPSFMKRSSIDHMYPSNDQASASSTISSVLAKCLKLPDGLKPFTYTPGGLDLSKRRDLSHKKCYRESRSASEDRKPTEPIMSRRMIVPPEQLNQHHYSNANPVQPFSYARQQPAPPPPKKHIQHDTDVITQSRSFQMLQGWISDSEKSTPKILTSSSTQPTANRSIDAHPPFEQHNQTDRRLSNSGGGSLLPSRSFRYLQEQYKSDDDNVNNKNNISTKIVDDPLVPRTFTGLRRSSDAHNPSRSFRFLQDQYDTSQDTSSNQSAAVNNRNDLMEIYNKLPPSFREHEPEAPRYQGSIVPSRAFRILQMMTQDDEPKDSKSADPNAKSQQLLNKYDEKNLLKPVHNINEHPSRSFRYLQEMTGEQPSTNNQTVLPSSTLPDGKLSTDIGESDF